MSELELLQNINTNLEFLVMLAFFFSIVYVLKLVHDYLWSIFGIL